MSTTLDLRGYRVLITRPRNQASALRSALQERGAEVVSIPVIEIVPPACWHALDAALLAPEPFDWLVLTSANAAESVAQRLQHLGRTHFLSRLAVVGSATAEKVHALGLFADEFLQPERATAESLAEALAPRIRHLLRSQAEVRLLLPRAEQAPELLPHALRAAGASVTAVPAYRNRVPEASTQALQDLFAQPEHWPAVVPFTSSSSVTAFLQALQQAGLELPLQVRCVSIGEVTSRTLRQFGLHVSGEAQVASVAGLVVAVMEALLQP